MDLNLSRRNTRWVVAKLFSMMESFRFESRNVCDNCCNLVFLRFGERVIGIFDAYFKRLIKIKWIYIV